MSWENYTSCDSISTLNYVIVLALLGAILLLSSVIGCAIMTHNEKKQEDDEDNAGFGLK